ncbi:MAG: HAD-IIIA family hydrolase [Chitinophagales bacterium]|nr:HAD-IIIA family hydrolase [Chitinophagales bacterium]
MKIEFDSNWTLFLDRDGVINKNINDAYILNWDEFEFIPSFLSCIKELSDRFKYIIVITNQQCIAKGLLTHEGLAEIHLQMINRIVAEGGRIDAIYFAPDLASPDNILRKPNIGMPLQAQNDFPDIDFSKSFIIGDKDSDIELGKRLGMKTIWMKNNQYFSERADINISSFNEFIKLVF